MRGMQAAFCGGAALSPGTRADRRKAAKAGRSARQQRQAGPDMAFRSDPVRPMAKVVIQADDHVQLDKILVALHLAVSSYQQPTTKRATAATH